MMNIIKRPGTAVIFLQKMDQSIQQHWDQVFASGQETELSWFQPYPVTSMEFIELFKLPLEARIIDIGGGDSHLVDALIKKGYQNVYVLDISSNAIERSKQRLGSSASNVQWLVSDITDFEPAVEFDLWHDRAAFHFLTTEEKINKYISIAQKAIKKDGYLILGTFSENGPKKCSGLEIRQYSEILMSERFDKYFQKVKCIKEEHHTPSNAIQNFLFCSFRRK